RLRHPSPAKAAGEGPSKQHGSPQAPLHPLLMERGAEGGVRRVSNLNTAHHADFDSISRLRRCFQATKRHQSAMSAGGGKAASISERLRPPRARVGTRSASSSK